MNDDTNPSRRRFIKVCSALAASLSASPRLLAATGDVVHHYHRVMLIDTDDKPLRPEHLNVGENYLFYYPFLATPCFLLNLGQPMTDTVTLKTAEGLRYQWTGGVGPQHSVVAFSAICSHKMSHPARSVSFINYRPNTVSFFDKQHDEERRSEVIYCCSERSVYDPLHGARVLGGPAPQPLATILLDYEPRDETLYAVGTAGGEMFDKFFAAFSLRLTLEHRTTDIRRPITKTAQVMPLKDYCANQILC